MDKRQLTILCISSYEKGHDFIKECKAQGCRVILLTSKSLENASWPRECIDEIFYISDVNKEWNMRDVIYGVSYLARSVEIVRNVTLNDFDVERTTSLRDDQRVAGMRDTSASYFMDMIAMRTRAAEA